MDKAGTPDPTGIRGRVRGTAGKQYWRGSFLTLTSASLALAGVGAASTVQPDALIVPDVRQPDALYFFVIAVSALFALFIAAVVIGFGVKYHRRHAGEVGARIGGNLPLELLWSVIPTLIAMVIFGWGVSMYYHLRRPPEVAIEHVRSLSPQAGATGVAGAAGATVAVPSSGATGATGPVRQRQ